MLFKKSKAVVAAVLSVAMAANAMIATMGASAAGTRTKPEAFGDSTYAERFLSLYDDVVTKGQTNGYLSSEGIPYHAVEEVIIEAPDYGHETTSEAMSYIVWIAAMRDNIAANHQDQVGTSVTNTGELSKAWKVMENMIPTEQGTFWQSTEQIKATQADECESPKDYPSKSNGQTKGTAANPMYSVLKSAYPSDKGVYLMHWLADVDNWYGYGTGTSFTFINTFQRGENESCWETVPHPCVEMKKFGNPQQGVKGLFNGESDVSEQYAYTNAPDAEDRALQGVFDANKWGVGDSAVNTLAGKMGDELRNNFYDKYYQTIGESTTWTEGGVSGKGSAHFLRNWYTSWGGSLGQYDWIWQIGCSHCHEFYQNPLAAYALVTEPSMSSNMKAADAVEDYTTSLERQMEFYLWLQSANGPIAGGATNSWNGRYEAYPAGISTFHGMAYLEHPVYADPGSNHWIGNQVWAVQRLSELYYWVLKDGKGSVVKPGGMNLDAALEQILDKWVVWFLNNTVLTENGDYYIPSNLNWTGQPDSWSGSPSANSGLTCEITGYGNADLGCVSSLANTLIYYAKAKGATAADIAGFNESSVGAAYKSGIDDANAKAGTTSYSVGDAKAPAAALYLAQQLCDRAWELGRDDIGLSRTEHNGSLARFFAQEVWVPTSYQGTMPNGDAIKNGIKFLDIRSMYTDASKCMGGKTSTEAIDLVKKLQAAYEKDVAAGASWDSDVSASKPEGSAQLAKFTNVADVELHYHRFWHAGDELMALGVMAELYPDLKPGAAAPDQPTTDAPTEPPTVEDDPITTKKYGDVNCDGDVDLVDVVLLNKHLMIGTTVSAQGIYNGDVDDNNDTDEIDSLNILKYIIQLVDFPVKN